LQFIAFLKTKNNFKKRIKIVMQMLCRNGNSLKSSINASFKKIRGNTSTAMGG
jgi:hypothetical protein